MKRLKYLRDGRAPIPKNETVSRVMSANRGKNTVPEIKLRKSLWEAGLRGYRTHVSTLRGKPDIVFASKKIAVFMNGCFWHRCPFCRQKLPKTNSAFWQAKFKRNVARDKRNVTFLRRNGWRIAVIRECRLKKNPQRAIEKIYRLYSRQSPEI
jgi:DNA mismatch endonuclease (patch repair protein)